MQHVLLAAVESKQTVKQPEIVIHEDENRKRTAGEALNNLDEVKIS